MLNKNDYIERIKKIESASQVDGYERKAVISDWNNYGKSRTYFSIVETRENSKHYAKKDYGYYDNAADKYIAGKSSLDGDFAYDFGGNEKVVF